ncbi:hypothetical protein A3A66_04600 [Microgenomates group bacterium RIFCSPLOWO2_01_FULL_46_13]|nr:MAG: hypothetical protein A2783_05075 [Microgenomates group bacterium RIFCSPHIGHO2_01_FULL_45_11]OGV94248.1 MAG: hypothetical protein A3A66_04600 [Microgenomates group bacterium RIFCSPLOWO2_01_FULL_46_13]
MNKHKFITVIGPIGAGKTTASQMIAEKLKIPLVDADLFEQNPFLPNYITDNSRWSFATELFFTLRRIKKLAVLPKLMTQSSVVVDSGLIMSHHVYTKNHLVQGTMTAAEWDFFSEIVADYEKALPHPDIIVNLLADPKTQLKRIKDRGRSFEAGYTLEYLKQITDRIDEYVRSLDDIKDITLINFDTDKSNELYGNGQKKFLQLIRQALRD